MGEGEEGVCVAGVGGEGEDYDGLQWMVPQIPTPFTLLVFARILDISVSYSDVSPEFVESITLLVPLATGAGAGAGVSVGGFFFLLAHFSNRVSI